MARSRSVILSVDDRKAVREAKKALMAQLKEAKVELRVATSAMKKAERETAKIQTQLDKQKERLVADKTARASS